jgi:predicted HTH domain antitoxin
MTRHAVMTGLTLYRTETVTLEQAASCGGTTPANFAAALRARGIPVREEADPASVEPDANAA